MALHRNFTGPISTTETVKSSKDMASLVACTLKKFLAWGCRFFVSDVIKWRTSRPPWSTSPGPKLLDGSISVKFLLETRLQSKSFDTLDDLLGFQIQKL